MKRSLNGLHSRYLFVLVFCLVLLGYGAYGIFNDLQQAYTALQATTVNNTSANTQQHEAFDLFGISHWLYLGLMGLGILILIGSSLSLYHKTINSIQHDIKSLARMFKDMREGSVRIDYPMVLREFGDIFKYLRDSSSKIVEEKRQFKKMGLIDHLSKVSNRRHFESRLAELFESVKTHGPSSVLIIDLDHFKSVNDNHGHDAGDTLIVAFSLALRRLVRKTDFIARLGGDEFCIIYVYTDLKKSADLAERLREQLPREIKLPNGATHPLRWTGGLSIMADQDKKFDDVLWRADQALLQAKEAGRNNTRLHGVTKQVLKNNLRAL